ncbi:hypothetical protein D9757_003864 [Collybiopsis confluens]|uniref:Uncharacterized protein n=1 Tax=Collybiopsis confluens TaxID=2823264 RepID=A0A8H5HVC1_9AGAR|nr:hypothetical protein D9757_003864 [Collybiopsis confluens]
MRRLRQPKPDAQDANGQSSVPLPPKPLDVRFSPYIIPPEQQAHKAARSAPIHSAKPTPSPPATLHRAVFESRSPSPASSRSRSRSLTPNSFVLPRPPSHSPQPPKRLPPPSALLRGVPPGGHVFKVQLGVGTGSSR